MAVSDFILVPILYSRPFNGVAPIFLESKMIAYAAQEFLRPAPEDSEGQNGYQSADLSEDGAIAAVHIFLKNSYMITPYTDSSISERGDGLPMMPAVRVSDIWIEGFLEDFYGMVMGARPPAAIPELGTPLIDYGSEVITDTTIDFDIAPVTDADTYYVTMNGELIQDAITTAISVSGLDGQTDYTFVIQARKNDLTFKYSQLNIQTLTTTASP